MSRRLHDLTLANLDDVPEGCRACVFWEVADAPRGPATDSAVGRERKEAWWQATQLEWGTPGKAAYIDGSCVGFAAFAPGTHYPRAVRLGGVSDDALLLATLWVDPAFREAGLARVLLQSVLRETSRRGGRALEAYADRRGTNGRAARCMLDEGFLLANGFAVLREHPTTPRLRLDLRHTVRWQESLSAAVEGVAAALGRRERAPAPARSVPALPHR
ncbi:MAG TPA: GNAT family N-acetyltransferase [Egibacteraceae bacterium]|nr:GNAT family N-acetyltransferase [Egibacteraceae bacterium]